MAPDTSAYAALGVEPGADAATIEQAYKRLIKQYHPDRQGGDSARAAEINLAYRQLRQKGALRDSLELNDLPRLRRSGGRGIFFFILSLLLLAGTLLLLTDGGRSAASRFLPLPANMPLGKAVAKAVRGEPMDKPLYERVIDAAVANALQIARDHDQFALAAASQKCQAEFRARPSLEQLDRCAAFDDAAVQILDRDPLRDRSPFSDLTVTRRQWSAASMLSDDYLAIDSRLSQVSVRVQLALAPPDSQPGPADPVS